MRKSPSLRLIFFSYIFFLPAVKRNMQCSYFLGWRTYILEYKKVIQHFFLLCQCHCQIVFGIKRQVQLLEQNKFICYLLYERVLIRRLIFFSSFISRGRLTVGIFPDKKAYDAEPWENMSTANTPTQ